MQESKEKSGLFRDYCAAAKTQLGRGFTLIELLVVLAIISMLMAILLPTLGKVRQQARSMLIASNQRQIITAVSLYAADNDGQYPESVATIGQGSYWNWQEPTMLTGYRKRSPMLHRSMSEYLQGYIEKASILSCPSSPKEHTYLQDAWDAGDEWGNPDAPMLKGPLTGTYCFYWNYTGYLGGRRGLFKGPMNTSGGPEQSKLLVSCYFGYDHWRSRNAYSSCEQFRNANIKEETWFSSSYWFGLNSSVGMDTLAIKLRAGYTDGHVDNYSAAEAAPMKVIMKRATLEPYPSGIGPGLFFLPGND